MITDEIAMRYARLLFTWSHPRKVWQHHPNFKQEKEQAIFVERAKVLLNRMLQDPDIQELLSQEKSVQ